MYPQQIIDALRHVRYPGNGKDLIESGMLEDDIRISGLQVSFSLIFDKENDPFMRSVIKASEAAVRTYAEPNAAVNIHAKFRKQTAPLIDYYTDKGILKTVDGTKDVDEVFTDIEDILEA